jgi:hypothetical protein
MSAPPVLPERSEARPEREVPQRRHRKAGSFATLKAFMVIDD